jgi:hypothetical protein
MRRLRFFVAWGHRWLPFGHHLWAETTRAADLAGARLAIRRFFEAPHRMLSRTSR